jgi:hypothetical protein
MDRPGSGLTEERPDEVREALDLRRVLSVFERSYRISSADFYRAHVRNEAPAVDLSHWHREVWSGTYRQWLRDRAAGRSVASTVSQPDPVSV